MTVVPARIKKSVVDALSEPKLILSSNVTLLNAQLTPPHSVILEPDIMDEPEEKIIVPELCVKVPELVLSYAPSNVRYAPEPGAVTVPELDKIVKFVVEAEFEPNVLLPAPEKITEPSGTVSIMVPEKLCAELPSKRMVAPLLV